MPSRFFKSLLILSGLIGTQTVLAETDYTLRIKDHQFNPAELTVPAGTKVKLTVINEDATPEEFESDDLHREKVIKGNSQAIIIIGPLKPGTYSFVGEFHEDSAKGRIIAK